MFFSTILLKEKKIKPHHLTYSVISKADSSILCREIQGQAAQAEVAGFHPESFGEDRGERSSKSPPSLCGDRHGCWSRQLSFRQGDRHPVEERYISYLKQKWMRQKSGDLRNKSPKSGRCNGDKTVGKVWRKASGTPVKTALGKQRTEHVRGWFVRLWW